MTTSDLILLIAIVAVLLDWLLAWRSSRRLANALAASNSNTSGMIRAEIAFYYGPGCSITCDENVFQGSQRLDDECTQFYGHRYLVCESVSREAAEIIVKAVGGVLK